MTANSIHSLFSLLRKTIEKNAIERTKYAQTPSKFMDSEVALHQELIKWKGVAAFPNLFAHCLEIKDDFVPLLLSLLQHENIDIHYDVIAIIADWTDIEDLGEMEEDDLEAIAAIAKAFVEKNVLTSLVQILERFEKVDVAEINNAENMEQDDQEDKEHETQKVIYHILQIFENMAELAPDSCVSICSENTFLSHLVRLIAEKESIALERKSGEGAVAFPQNKLYASEVLSIMLQLANPVQEAFMDDGIKKKTTDRFDKLLRIIALYRKRNPSSEDEEEFLENIFNALCTLLLTQEAKNRFRHLEGLELLLRLLKDRTSFMHAGALRLLDHSLMESPRNCEHLVEIGGLRHIFSILMGKTGRYRSRHVSKGTLERVQEKQEEYTINIITSMCVYLSEKARADGFARFHSKLMEKEYEKLDRLIDLFARYYKRVQEEGETETDLQDAETENNREEEQLLRRLDAGLFTLQRLAFVLAHCCVFSAKMNGYTVIKFHERQLEFESLNMILHEQLGLMQSDENQENVQSQDGLKSHLQALCDQFSAHEEIVSNS